MKGTSSLILLLIALYSKAQLPDTDIYLCNVKKENNRYFFSKPENITQRSGYDNQPCFTTDGNKILYVSIRDTTQSDVYIYDIRTKNSKQYTSTAVSEYSPAYTPDKKFISVVRVDSDSAQRFYKLPLNNPGQPEAVMNTEKIGYACWINDTLVAMFILGDANTLQLLNTKTSERRLIASDIGRCMKLSPDGKHMYFILKSNEKEWYVYSMNCINYKLEKIAPTTEGNEDFAVMPDGSLIMGQGTKLFQLSENKEWLQIADFKDSLPGFYRIVVNEKGNMLALVAFTGKKP